MSSSGSAPAVPTAAPNISTTDQSADASWTARLSQKTNAMLAGKLNVVLQIRLAQFADSTTVTDSRIGVNSSLILQPLNPDAAAALYGTGVIATAQQDGSVVFTHDNNSNVRNFNLVILG